jgi:CubicO group peptidase (beta-lactamase class C family)
MRSLLPILSLAALAALLAGFQRPNPETPRSRARQALQHLLAEPEPDVERFVERQIAPSLRAGREGTEIVQILRTIAQTVRGAELADVRPEGPFGATLVYQRPGEAPVEIAFEIASEPPHGIVDVWIEGGPRLDPRRAGQELSEKMPLSWSDLEERLAAEETQGFSGAVLVVHDGRIVLHKGYGLADRKREVRWGGETIFGIGSTPIDFTKAGVLLLVERGKLALEDPISKHFPEAPEAKRAITIEQLMTGRSGLPDFLGLPSDPDPDHFPIDRAEAVRRIFAAPLRFAPGARVEPSHAAFGLLAAAIEVASGESYPLFVRRELFAPAGMRDTGFFGEPLPPERVAIGYGDLTDGAVNAPPYWGETSWLVEGSGGMTSTLGDLCRWQQALRRGDVLAPASLARYWSPAGAVLAGGDAFGYEVVYTEGARDRMWIATNAGGTRAFRALSRDLAKLVLQPGGAGFVLGIELELDDNDGFTVKRVVPGGPAERAGLQAGDRLKTLGGEPLAVGDTPFEHYQKTGEVAVLAVERAGETLEIRIKPEPRAP